MGWVGEEVDRQVVLVSRDRKLGFGSVVALAGCAHQSGGAGAADAGGARLAAGSEGG